MKSDPDELALAALRRRTQGRSLRVEDPFDRRAFLYRAAVKLAQLHDPDADRVAAALLAVVDNDEPPRLDALLGVPVTWRVSDTERRDYWIRRAAEELEVPAGSSVRKALEREWADFLVKLWPAWRDDDMPPPDCAWLNQCLHQATRFNRGRCLTGRQIGSILGREIGLG